METRQQRQYDIWASNLLFFAFGLSLPINYVLHEGFFASNLQAKDYVVLYLISPVMLVLYYYIRKGERAVKTLFLVLYGLAILQILSHSSSYIPTNASLETFDFFSQHTITLTACLLILLSFRSTKPANDKPTLHA
jgi:hypothetical protein